MSFRSLSEGENAGRPEPGSYQAVLDTAAMRKANATGDDLVLTEWKTVGGPLYGWTTWFNFKGGLQITREFLAALGISYDKINRDNPDDDDARDAFDDALGLRVGTVYTVDVSHWGDTGINTVVMSAAAQQQLADLPVEPVTVPAAADDDIPF